MDTKIKPKVSFVVPTYGRSEYLQKLVDSLRASTPKDSYEIVVVSSDLPDSEKVKWLSQQPDVHLILYDTRYAGSKRKKSLYHYTNVGIYAAKHEWVFVVNDDMVFDSQWYKELIKLISNPQNSNIGMIIVATHIGDVKLGYRVAVIGKIKKKDGSWKDLYLSDLSLIHKDVLKQIGYFDEHLDWFGSGADNTLGVEFLTNKDIVIGDKIKVSLYITDEHRAANVGNAFNDFNYIIKKWNTWCKENGCEYQVDFGNKSYTFYNRALNFIKKVVRERVFGR